MLPPDYFDGCLDELMLLYNKLDDAIIADIAKRLVKYGGVTKASQWQILKAQEQGLLYEDVIDKVADITNASNRHVKALFEDAGLEAVYWDNKIYEAAGLASIPIKKSPAALQVLLAGITKTRGLVNNLTLTTALQAQRAYIDAATFAEMQIESGAFSYNTAVSNAIKKAAAEGAAVQYPSGHIDKLDVAIRRATLTGVNQTCGNISLQYAADVGSDLVETTAHHGARPEHMTWQGKVFSISGKHPKYPPFSQTGYGEGSGLCGWNCRHSFYPFFDGLSESAYPKSKLNEYEARTVEYNGEAIPYYDATQRQRKLERDIRATRRELAGLDSGINNSSGNLQSQLQDDFNNAAAKLKRQEAKLKDFVAQTGLQRDSNRYQTLGFGRSVSQKAVWANKHIPEWQSRQKFSQDVYILPPIKGDAITHRSLYNDLMRSETGKKAIDAILSEKYDIEINYTNECHPFILGTNIGNHIYIYAQNTKTVKRTAETLIHEMTHATEKIGGNQWAEARCIAAEWMHRKGSLTTTDLRAIIRLVKELYPLLDWRKV